MERERSTKLLENKIKKYKEIKPWEEDKPEKEISKEKVRTTDGEKIKLEKESNLQMKKRIKRN